MNEWILTDMDNIKALRNIEGSEWQVFQIVDTMVEPYGSQYALKEICIDLDNYLMDEEFVTEYLKSYGYDSVDDVRKQYGIFSDQIIVECVAETEVDFCGETIKRGTFDECLSAFEEKTGLPVLEEWKRDWE